MQRRLRPVFQIVILVLLAVAALLGGLGALLPRHWQVERSIMINARPTAVHHWVNDLEHWSRWAQWDQADLAPQNTVSNPSSGVGASLTWRGHDRSRDRAGEVRIVWSDPEHGVRFAHWMAGAERSRALISYAAKAGVTEVTWRDEGELPPIVGGFFLDYYQSRLGEHIARGLARLKELAEHTPPAPEVTAPEVTAPQVTAPQVTAE